MADASARTSETDVASQTGRMIERPVERVPETGYLGLAFGSMALSAVTTLLFGRKTLGNFIGLWVPSLLLLGVYRKISKIEEAVGTRSMVH